MSFADNLGNLSDEHGDKINDAVDGAQEQHGDELGEHGDKTNGAVDGAQEKLLGGQTDGEQDKEQ